MTEPAIHRYTTGHEPINAAQRITGPTIVVRINTRLGDHWYVEAVVPEPGAPDGYEIVAEEQHAYRSEWRDDVRNKIGDLGARVHLKPAQEDVEAAIERMRQALADPARVHEALIRYHVQPVGLTEIAEMLGVEAQTARNWRTRGVLPEPDWTVGGRPVWELRTIERWARQTGRMRAE